MTNTPANLELRLREALARFRGETPSATDSWRTALTLAFYAGELERAHRIVTDASQHIPPVSVLDDVIAPAMHDIGALWERHEITVADEHLATAVSHRLLAAVAPTLEVTAARSRERILLATPAPDQHFTGLLMANDVLYGAGYDTVMLGAGVPNTALSNALLRHRPAIVALSSTMPFGDAFAATAKMVAETLPAAQLITGGAGGGALPPGIAAHHLDRLEGLLGTVEAMLAPQRR